MRTTTNELKVLRDMDAANALAHPGRRRLVEALRERPDSATGLARRLKDTRQRLNYHLRALETAGVVEEQETRRRGNCTERVLRTSAAHFLVDPLAVAEAGAGRSPAAFGDRFSAAYLLALAARLIGDVGRLWDRSAASGKRLATAGLDVKVSLASPAEFDGFVRDLSDAVATVIRKHHAPGGESRRFKFVAGLYPAGGAVTEEGPEAREDDHGEP